MTWHHTTDIAAWLREGPRYQVIYADPPWRYNDQKGNDPAMGGIRYPTMSDAEIAALPVKQVAERTSALFLWATMPKLQEALDVMRAWGFAYRTTAFVWLKLNPDGSPYSGMGHWTNSNIEIVLFGKRGAPKRLARDVKQVVMAPVGVHSAKPDEVRRRIVRLMGNVPRVELFARTAAAGWDAVGNGIYSEAPLEDLPLLAALEAQ